MKQALSWVLFWLGHVWCVAFDREPFGLCGPLYTVYNRLMIASFNLQLEAGDKGPWEKV